MSIMTPREIASELDKHIVGQKSAKRAVAIALRNRWRRMQLDADIRQEITPKNILMIGPTGVGKTEIARRLARLANAPFIKVEATKFTEVGYVGRDVESIVRDLVDVAVKMLREDEMRKVRHRAEDAAEERILDALLPPASNSNTNSSSTASGTDVSEQDGKRDQESSTRQIFRKKLREGELDDKEIEVNVSDNPGGVEIMAPPGLEEMTSQLKNMFSNMNTGRKRNRRMPIKAAFRQLKDEEAAKLVNEEEIKTRAIEVTEQTGIVFIDEIDKVTERGGEGGGSQGGVSREGVQRDLLPLIEGSTVTVSYTHLTLPTNREV